MRKLKAFTIMELAVTMILSSITIGFAVASYLIIGKLHHQYHTRMEVFQDDSKLYSLLKQDVANSTVLLKNQNGFECNYNDSLQIDYTIEDFYIIRQQLRKIDSFEIELESKVFSFQELSVQSNNEKIDYIELDLKEKRIILQKEYAAVDLMKEKE